MARRKHRLGRLASKDRDRDEEFLMRRRLGAAGKPLPTRKTWALRSVALNQGDTGTCVGHAWRNFLRCAPVMMEKTGPSAYDIYRTAVPLDDWKANDSERNLPDEDPGLDYGTTVRAGAKAVTELGQLKSYLWAFALQPAIEWVLTQGPVVLGTDWWSSFERPDEEGIVRIAAKARVTGGHAYLWRGVDTKRGLALCTNSWGDDWGKSGEFYLPLRDLERLIADDGEVCTAVQQKIKGQAIAQSPNVRSRRAAM